jgi:hypothetical protein
MAAQAREDRGGSEATATNRRGSGSLDDSIISADGIKVGNPKISIACRTNSSGRSMFVRVMTSTCTFDV